VHGVTSIDIPCRFGGGLRPGTGGAVLLQASEDPRAGRFTWSDRDSRLAFGKGYGRTSS